MAGETPLTIVGNLTADPESHNTSGGHTVVNFTVASTPRTFDRQANDWKDGEALFVRCTAWRELGEHIAASLRKGARVLVQGTMRQENWEDKNGGGKRSALVLDVQACGPDLRYATAQVQRVQAGGGGQSHGAPQDAWAQPGQYDDETPF